MLPDERVFSVEGEPYCWRDVILAAVRWGEWRAAEQRARYGAACVRHAETTGDTLPAAAFDDAGREFRYARDLVTAQSMEEWLHRTGLSAHDWSNYLRRDLQRRLHPDGERALIARYPVADDAAVQLALVEAICSADLTRWAHTLAGRAAAHAVIAASGGGGQGEDPSANSEAPIDMHPFAVLWNEDPATLRTSARRLQRLDESFEQFRASLLTERALQDFVSARQLEWVRLDCRVMSFPDLGMAAEAALLLREDDQGFTSVYSVAHAQPRAAQFFLDQVDPLTRDCFMSARAGDLIGPIHVADEYVLYLIESKVLPTVRDADIRRRAESGVLEHGLDRQREQRVTWHAAQ